MQSQLQSQMLLLMSSGYINYLDRWKQTLLKNHQVKQVKQVKQEDACLLPVTIVSSSRTTLRNSMHDFRGIVNPSVLTLIELIRYDLYY